MDEFNSFPEFSPERRAPTRFLVRVEGHSTLPQANSLGAAMAKSVASGASASQSGSAGRAGPVDQIVRFCETCKEDRVRLGKRPRQLVMLPTEVTQHKTFHIPGEPVLLCSWCDGDAVEEALKQHQNRSANK